MIRELFDCGVPQGIAGFGEILQRSRWAAAAVAAMVDRPDLGFKVRPQVSREVAGAFGSTARARELEH